MTKPELLAALRRLKVETGSLACLGCGHERNCGIHGCAILREAEACIRGSANDREGPTESSAPTEGNRSTRVGAGDPARPTGREGRAPKTETPQFSSPGR